MEEEIFSLSTINTIKCGAKIEVHSALTRIAFQDSEVKGGKMIMTPSVANSSTFFKNNIFVNVIYFSPVLLEKC